MRSSSHPRGCGALQGQPRADHQTRSAGGTGRLSEAAGRRLGDRRDAGGGWIASVRYVDEHGSISRWEAAEFCALTAPHAYRLLKKMESEGVLRRIGTTGRGAHYERTDKNARRAFPKHVRAFNRTAGPLPQSEADPPARLSEVRGGRSRSLTPTASGQGEVASAWVFLRPVPTLSNGRIWACPPSLPVGSAI